jgi:hypothetical protein
MVLAACDTIVHALTTEKSVCSEGRALAQLVIVTNLHLPVDRLRRGVLA